MQGAATDQAAEAIRATPRWFGGAAAPLLGWLSPAATPATLGVVVVPPLGYHYWTTYGSRRAMAEALADAGIPALRYDHPGTGDSAGGQLDGDRIGAWVGGVAEAATELRALGCHRIGLLAITSSCGLALAAAGASGADAVALVAPTTRGRQLVRELRLLGTPVPAGAPGYPEGTVVAVGNVFTSDTLAGLSALDLDGMAVAGVGAALLVDREERKPNDDLAAHLAGAGVVLTRARLDLEGCLAQPTEYATVPAPLVAAVRDWAVSVAGTASPAGPPAPAPPAGGATQAAGEPAQVAGGPAQVAPGCREQVIEVAGLVAVRTDPDPDATTGHRPCLVLLNSGSEPHVGPGRAWVEFARAFAAGGTPSMRLDFSGWGESPGRGHSPGRPYDPHCVTETVDVVEALRGGGETPVVMGLCAGAWVALRALADGAPAAGVVALNPQLYWMPGDPVEADIVAETHERRRNDIDQQHRMASLGLWDDLDRVGMRHPAAVWLDRIVERRVPVLMAFAAGDDGLTFLRDRVGRAWQRACGSGVVRLAELPGIDHGMHRHWARGAITDAVEEWLSEALSGPPSDPSERSEPSDPASVTAVGAVSPR